jgi:hypothetical protein
MKRIIDYLYLPFLILGLLLSSCQKEYPKGIEHVVVIGIDGMSVQGFLEASTPCMDSTLGFADQQ